MRRVDGRSAEQIRPIRISAGAIPYAEGSAEVVMGSTRLLAAATIDRIAPEQLQAGSAGRVLASVSMLPRSTPLKLNNPILADALRAELQAIQSLLVRSLRSAIPNVDLGEMSLTVDCSVFCSDAGIAPAAIAAGWVAMYEALRWAALNKLVRDDLYVLRVAGISAGLLKGRWLLDLCAEEAANAEFVTNMIFDEKGRVIDLKASVESTAAEIPELSQLMQTALQQAAAVFKEQERAVLQLK